MEDRRVKESFERSMNGGGFQEWRRGSDDDAFVVSNNPPHEVAHLARLQESSRNYPLKDVASAKVKHGRYVNVEIGKFYHHQARYGGGGGGGGAGKGQAQHSSLCSSYDENRSSSRRTPPSRLRLNSYDEPRRGDSAGGGAGGGWKSSSFDGNLRSPVLFSASLGFLRPDSSSGSRDKLNSQTKEV